MVGQHTVLVYRKPRSFFPLGGTSGRRSGSVIFAVFGERIDDRSHGERDKFPEPPAASEKHGAFVG